MKLKYIGTMPSAVLYDGREVERGTAFDIPDEAIAKNLLSQEDNYAPADETPRAKPRAPKA